MALKGYRQFLNGIRQRILSARISAARAVNRDLILLYWDIGRAIVEKQVTEGWGDAVVETLARDLQREFPGARGFSAFNLWRMRQLYTVHTSPEFLAQAVPEIRVGSPGHRTDLAPIEAIVDLLAAVPWGHHVELLKKVKDHAARLYYLRAIAQHGWSRNVLLNQIKGKSYERSLRAGKSHNFSTALPAHLAEQAEQVLKSSYNLEFLGIKQTMREREMENRLIERLRDFMLELGYGFCFVGQQYRIVLGESEYFIDLLFYHRFLKSLIAVELKLGPFEPEFAGKMDFYLNVLNETERAPDDNPSIGIILCAEKSDLVVEFSLRSKNNPIGVAKYELTSTLPEELQGKLPTPQELRRALLRRDIRPALPGASEGRSAAA